MERDAQIAHAVRTYAHALRAVLGNFQGTVDADGPGMEDVEIALTAILEALGEPEA